MDLASLDEHYHSTVQDLPKTLQCIYSPECKEQFSTNCALIQHYHGHCNALRYVKLEDDEVTEEIDAEESDVEESDAEESDAKESDVEESDVEEIDAEESEVEESDAEESYAEEGDVGESDSQESDTQENDPQESDTQESDVEESAQNLKEEAQLPTATQQPPSTSPSAATPAFTFVAGNMPSIFSTSNGLTTKETPSIDSFTFEPCAPLIFNWLSHSKVFNPLAYQHHNPTQLLHAIQTVEAHLKSLGISDIQLLGRKAHTDTPCVAAVDPLQIEKPEIKLSEPRRPSSPRSLDTPNAIFCGQDDGEDTSSLPLIGEKFLKPPPKASPSRNITPVSQHSLEWCTRR